MTRTSHAQAHTLFASDDRRSELRRLSVSWPSWTVAGPRLADLEALINGWLLPIDGYTATQATDRGSLARDAGPTLDVSPALARDAAPGVTVGLRDPEGVLLAALHVQDRCEAGGAWRLGGRVEGIEVPAHEAFGPLRLSPAAIAARLRALGRPRAVAFVPGDLLHAGTRAALIDLASQLDAAIVVLIPSSSAEHDPLLDVAAVRALLLSASLLPPERTVVAVVPLRIEGADRRSLLRTALAARNCGADMVAVEVTDNETVDAAAGREIESELGISVHHFRSWAYRPDLRLLAHPDTAGGSLLEPPPPAREILSRIETAPGWLLTDAEIDALRRAHPPRHAQGFTVFFTGLSGSGKSTIARALRLRLMEATGRPVTLLDGDLVRHHLSSELGFSREHRDLNILRIGWVASEIVRHGGIAICAPIAPYDAIRKRVREMIDPAGGFLLVHVSTPLETCEARDRKGLYAKARAGLLPNFTGVSDPYEPPDDAALIIDTRDTSVDEACAAIVARLTSEGYLVQGA